MVVPSAPAKADWDASVGRGIDVTGVNQYGPLRLGPHYVETAQINGEVIEAYPIWCIQALYADPGPNQMTDIATLTDSRKLGPAELALETPQAAWLLQKYERNKDDNVNLAALSYLILFSTRPTVKT
ncbi:hypothetical protein [Actinobaculum suis]|uniref:hypothetical protein n=1 Tax=Actinobaculum suis TaxID=1657 RepID=UPI00114751D4|nr:hypothetical protein [Actinobaculum suis]